MSARTVSCLVLSFVAAALAVASSPVTAQGTKPCTLLKPAEVQAVATAPIGEGKADFLPPTATYSCEWKWTVKDFSPSLSISVSDASKFFPGMDVGSIKSAMLGAAGGLPKDMTVVPGVGEAANYKADSSHRGTAMAYLKGKVLIVVYQGTDATAKKDRVIGLLKTAASRL